MVPVRRAVPLLLAGLFAGTAHASERPKNHDAWLSTAAPRRSIDALNAPPVVIAAHDPGRGAPSLLWSPGAAAVPSWLSAEAAARLYIDRHREVYGVSRAALAGLRLRFVHDTGRGGIVVVLGQTVAGVDVFHGDVKVLLDRSRRLIGISGTPHPAAHAGAVRSSIGSDVTAVATAMQDRHGLDIGPQLRTIAGHGGWSRLDGPGMVVPARVRPVYYPLAGSLVPGRLVELQTRDERGHSVYQYVIADDGRVLHRNNATSDAHTYRVWAAEDGDKRPTDSPLIDFTPHPTGVPGDGPTEVTAPVLVTIDGFNSEADPWLAPGATETRGNNVDAYIDHYDPDGLVPEDGEFRGAVTQPGVFDWTYDLTQDPLASVSQSMAALTQLFYVTNWMHDWWYDSGFTEAAGNGQTDNYGRGGLEEDALHAEAQDGALAGKRNNASMSTPMDGASPRMQMMVWTGLLTEATIDLDPLGVKFTGGMAKYGPVNYDVTGPLRRVEDDAGDSPTDGCEPAVVDLAGTIALVDRGNCTYETKSMHAEQAGALGLVIIDNVEADLPPKPGFDYGIDDPAVPTMAVTKLDGAAILAALADEPQEVHMVGWSSVERDSSIDNMVIAHEYGHFVHKRLVQACTSTACNAESEGWGDFNALMMALRAGDDLNGAYASSFYTNFDTTGFYGIRRVTYSVDKTKNDLSFRHISNGEPLPMNHPIVDDGADNSEVHNAGEVWATMMWEAYVALQTAHAGDLSFEEVRRLMGDYIAAGMILAPAEPTFTQQRDGLLMAISAASQDDFVTVAEAFARRGAGSCAVSPPNDSITLIGVIEDFEVGASGLLLAATVEAQDLCDADGVVDPGETGHVRVEVYNGGVLPLPDGAVVEVVDPDPALSFPNGPSIALPAVAPLEMKSVTIDLALAEGVVAHKPLVLQVRLSGADVCGQANERVVLTDVAADAVPASAASDDVEALPFVWTIEGGASEYIWFRLAGAQGGHFWHADDVGYGTDTALVSPPLSVGDDPLIVSFDHAHSFEVDDTTNYDGGVVEVSSDDGMTWVDVATLTADAGYQGSIDSQTNVLDGRPAFVGESASYPALDHAELDLGTALAGQTIRLRFRVGTDGGVGGPGWDLDNIAFAGLTNKPFPSWVDDPGCGESSETGDTPTTGDEPGTTGAQGTGSDDDGPTGGGDVSSSSDSAPLADEDLGCGCASGTAGDHWQAAPWLLLLGLGRRRTRRTNAPG